MLSQEVNLKDLNQEVKQKMIQDIPKLIGSNIESSYLVYNVLYNKQNKELRVRLLFDLELI